MSTPTRFLILANIRTGSTLLNSLLDAHPHICCEGELFATGCDTDAAHRHVERRASQHLGHAYGFSFHLGQVQDATQKYSHHFVHTLVGDGWSVVYLYRRNVVRHALSRMVAQHHAQWHRTTGDVLPAVHVDVMNLMATVRRFEVVNQLYEQVVASLPYLPVNYEDDLLPASAHQPTVDRICQYLAIPPAPVSTTLRRSTASDLTDVIANYTEIADRLADTRYACYL